MEKKVSCMGNRNDGNMEFVMPEGSFAYACCGNCRYFDGDDWCGYRGTHTTGGDHCGCWRDEDD